MKKFEEIITNDIKLSKLLNDKTITGFTDFSRSNYTGEFKTYIEDKYIASFKDILKTGIETKNETKINALIRTIEFLASEKSKMLLEEDLLPILLMSHKNLLHVKELINNENQLITIGNKLDNALSSTTINILNKLDSTANISDYKNKIINVALDICDSTSKASPKNETVKYAIYNVIMNNLLKITDLGEAKERYGFHNSKISQKRTGIEVKYWLGVVAVVVFIIIRILLKLK